MEQALIVTIALLVTTLFFLFGYRFFSGSHIEGGLLSKNQFEEARRIHQQITNPHFAALGEREDVMKFAYDRGIPFVDLERVDVDASAINSIPAHLAREHSLIPVKRVGQKLWLALSDINNIRALEEARLASGCSVHPCMALPAAIMTALNKYYG